MWDELYLIIYGSIVSFTWFILYQFGDYSTWSIVRLDGVVHLICGSIVALTVIQIPQFKRVEVVAILVLVLFFWEILERGIFGAWTFGDYWLMDTTADLTLGAIGGFIIIFDGHKLENLQHQGD